MHVQLYVYDLSQVMMINKGMARMMSLPLTGRQIDGIWHTSIVVFGKEICFGQGIQVFSPQVTPYGSPVEKISMGVTQIPEDVFWEYIETLKTIWTAEKYHLLENNCNSFTDEVCQFLVGKGIPKHITGLPAEFLSTPLGQQLFGKSTFSPAGSMNSLTPTKKQVIDCTNLTRLLQIIQSNRSVAVFCTSATCPPCNAIAPVFEKHVVDMNIDKEQIVGVSVEISLARDIADHFEISATPTFIFFLDGKKFSDFRGADAVELKSSIELLVYSANPPHPNSRLNLEHLVKLSKADCVHFSLSSDLEKIFGKLKEFVSKQNVVIDLEGLKKYMMEHNLKTATSLPRQWGALTKLLEVLPAKELFPLLDILRLLVQNPIASRQFVYEDTKMVFVKVINRVLDSKDAGMATKLMLLKFTCNLFSLDDPHYNFRLVTSQLIHDCCPRDTLTRLIVDTLLAPEHQLRQASSLLAFNVAWTCTQIRGFIKLPCIEFDEHWVSEMMAALCSTVENETTVEKQSDETMFRLVSAVGLLLSFASPTVVDLARVVGLESNLDTIAKQNRSQHAVIISKLCKEIKRII